MNYGARKKAREEAEYHKGSKDVSSAKFDSLMKKINALNINNQKRLECLVYIIYEKALGDSNSSKACANMCNKLSTLKVPADNASSPDQCVSFRSVIITRCQAEFIFEKTNEAVLKLEKELNECTGRVKRKGLILMLADHYRKEQKRSIGNVRFIGELYNQNMLTSKIIVYCMNHLVDKLEEEKLERLCELLKTTGVNLEDEVKEQLDDVFKKMQDYVDDKSSEISSRVRFMIEEVTELRRSRWVVENVVDSQIKMFALHLGASELIEWFKTSQS